MTTNYFLNASDAFKRAFDSENGGGTSEQVEARLKSKGIKPAGYIRGMRGGQVVLRPFYNPDDINTNLEKRKSIESQIRALEAQLAAISSSA